MMKLVKILLVATLAMNLSVLVPARLLGQAAPPAKPAPTAPDETGPTTDSGPAIIKKKKDGADPPPPPAPDREKIKNPNGETYSLRVDVPIVSLDVNVILDKTHQFVPGLKPANFLVLEDGVEQEVQTVRMTQTPDYGGDAAGVLRRPPMLTSAICRMLQ